MGRDEWLAERRKGIGGSDWQHVLGIEPYGCARRCWYDKTGTEPDYPQIETGVMKRGKKLERLVVEEFVDQHNRSVWYPDDSVNAAADFQEHYGFAGEILPGVKRPDWWVGTPDGAVTPLPGERKPSVLEIKTKGPWVFVKVKKDGVPEAELAQVQHYLGLTGWQHATIAYFEPATWELLTLEVERDDVAIAGMVEAGRVFWESVKSGEAPEQLDARSRQCKDCPWFPTCQGDQSWDGIEETGDYEDSDDPEIASMVRERIEIAAVKKESEEMLDKINEALVSLAGAGTKLRTADGHKLRVSDGSYTAMDNRAFAAELPRLKKRLDEKYKRKMKGSPAVYIYPRKEAENG